MTIRSFMGKSRRRLIFRCFLVLLPVLLLSCAPAWAKPTTPAQARRVVATWLALDSRPLGAALAGQVLEVQSFPPDAAEPDYFIVSLDPAGFVVVPADDLVEPIIAFAPLGRYDPSPDNPLGALVSGDVPGRVFQVREMASQALAEGLKFSAPPSQEQARLKWQLLDTPGMAAGVEPGSALLAGVAAISDVWVSPLLQSKWGQDTEGGLACYNYYTPPNASGTATNYPSGCVATCMAQLMRYHTYPTAGVGVHNFNIHYDDVSTIGTTRGGDGSGGPYAWANMVLDPDGSTTDLQRRAIGALTYDAGVAVNMNYTASGSSASLSTALTALRNTFQYSNTKGAYNSGNNLPLATLNTIINPNLDAGLPVPMSIRRVGGGHAVVADGYGYDLGTIYHHVNMGWSGSKDAWYNLPDISIPEWDRYYNTIDFCGYNIYISGTGEIISGRVTDAGGAPLAGVEVAATRSGGLVYRATTDSRGIYALSKVPSASTYTVTATKSGYAFSQQVVATGTSQDFTLNVGNLWGVDFTGADGPKGFLPPIYQLLLN